MKKLLIWDADETLWDGSLLELGVDGVQIHPERIRFLRELSGRGVLQSIASHNPLHPVLSVLRRYNLEDVFLAPQASVEASKPRMIAAIRESLNLARMADIVFVDDNPHNLAEVVRAYPEVTVLPPLDPVIDALFYQERYTHEDRSRVARYRAEQMRAAAQKGFTGSDIEFLKSCGFRFRFRRAEPQDFPRICSLVERANQYAALTVAPNMKNSMPDFYVAEVSDKYANYGLSAWAWAEHNTILGFVVSCSLAGKGIGSAMMYSLLNAFPDADANIHFHYRKTSYNESVAVLLKWFNFQPRETKATQTDLTLASYMRLPTAELPPFPEWITRD